MSLTIDLEQKLNIKAIADRKNNYTKANGQNFYRSPSGKKTCLAELLPNGDYWIVKGCQKPATINIQLQWHTYDIDKNGNFIN